MRLNMVKLIGHCKHATFYHMHIMLLLIFDCADKFLNQTNPFNILIYFSFSIVRAKKHTRILTSRTQMTRKPHIIYYARLPRTFIVLEKKDSLIDVSVLW